MKTLCFTIVFASMIAIYTSVDSKSEYLVKISFTVPELTDAEVEAKVNHQLGSLNGVKQNIYPCNQ